MGLQRAHDSRFIYLHGFAGGPDSTKAKEIGTRLSERGLELVCPNLNQPDFASLTVTRMLGQLGTVLESCPSSVTLIGSSLGGALAILAADRFASRVTRVVLFAPAVRIDNVVDLAQPMTFAKGEGSRAERIEEWRRRGSMPFEHFGYGKPSRNMDLKFSFYEDSLQHDPWHTALAQPTLILQGREDVIVPYEMVMEFASARSNVECVLLEDDHRLGSSSTLIWTEVEAFLELTQIGEEATPNPVR
jgi:pimeloyl-ACP methyl ester carboxylesterase